MSHDLTCPLCGESDVRCTGQDALLPERIVRIDYLCPACGAPFRLTLTVIVPRIGRRRSIDTA